VRGKYVVKNHLWEHLQGFFQPNAAPIVQEAICEIGSLDALNAWEPSIVNPSDALKVVDWGIPLVQIKRMSHEITNLNPLRQKIGSAIATEGEPNSSDLAELDVAALMILNNVQKLKRVQVETNRTPDFHVQWDEQIVELEVTKALTKDAHTQLYNFADELRQKIFGRKLPWIISVFFTAKLSDADIHSLYETLDEQKPGRYSGSSGKWWLSIEVPPAPVPQAEFNTKIDFSKIGYPKNDGWPSEIAKGQNSVAISLDNPEKGMISVRLVGVFPGVPVRNYLNRLQRKVERMQASGHSPFMIGIDIGDLPDGYNEYMRLLPMYLKEYPAISAVLLFERQAKANKFVWVWELYLNSEAKYPLPSAMLQNFQKQGGISWPYFL